MNITNQSFLITGAAGFIGSHIVAYLLNNGAKFVRVLDNLSNGKMSNIEIFQHYPNYEFVEGEITDYHTCMKACIGIDKVCHQAAVGSVPRSIKTPLITNDSNVNGFLNMIFAAKEAGIKRFVYASSSSVYGDHISLPKTEENLGNPMSPYAVSKLTNELYGNIFGNLYGMEVLGLRYFNVFGPRQDPYGQYAAVIPLFVKAVLNREPVYIDGDGEQTRDFTYVENAVQANICALTTENQAAFGQVYNIAFGESYSVNYMYTSICNLLKIRHTAIYREQRQGDIRNSLADVSKAKELLGYQPKINFAEGLPLTVGYYKELFG